MLMEGMIHHCQRLHPVPASGGRGSALRRSRWLWRAASSTVGILWVCGSAEIRAAGDALADLSLEELVNLKVTSVSKKEENLKDAAAAIFVLSHEDLRRSGATTVADALRLVPGLQVAALDASNWAISARGFNSQFANKLLVMVDGRTVYTPVFSGVYWDIQQVFLDDVDRIEVIRGPGATIWGANAVNGVISIISKSARDTQGGLVYGGGGDVHRVVSGIRYGDRIGESTYYRVYGTYQLDDAWPQENGQPDMGEWNLFKGGFRLDHYAPNSGQLVFKGEIYEGDLLDNTSEVNGFNLLGRWSQTFSERSGYEVQTFFDHTFRDNAQADVSIDTTELTFEHTFGLGQRNDVIWGLGYRYADSHIEDAKLPGSKLTRDHLELNLFSAFIQNACQLVPEQLTLTLGTKIEHNDFTGWEVQPSARLTYRPTQNQTLWAAVSRAVRTPSQTEGETYGSVGIGPPIMAPGIGMVQRTITGNPDARAEVLCAYEIGYRIQPNDRISLDTAIFYNDYSDLLNRQPTDFIFSPPLSIRHSKSDNTLDAESYGGEVLLAFSANKNWRLSASYSLLLLSVHGEPESDAELQERNTPTHQAVLRSFYDIAERISLDTQLRYVDNTAPIAAYLTADARIAYRYTDRLELSVTGQNLLDDRHPEQVSLTGAPVYEVPRGFYGKVTWRF